MAYIGRLINVWFGLESIRGTKVAMSTWISKTDCSFDEKNETIQDESSIGVLTDSRDIITTKKWAEWELSWNIETNSIGYLFYNLLGSVVSAAATAGAFIHTINLSETNTSPSLTIGVKEPVLGSFSYPLAMIESMTISAEEWQQATFSVEFKAKAGEVQAHTVSYAIDNKLLARHSILKTATNLAWLWGAASICIKSFEITFTKNLEDDYCMGGINPVDFINKQFGIEWSFTAIFDTTTLRTLQLAWTKQAIRFELKDSATTIGVSNNPWLMITLPLAWLTEFSRTQGNDEVVTQTLTFKGLQSIADGKSIEVVLTNTKATYVPA